MAEKNVLIVIVLALWSFQFAWCLFSYQINRNQCEFALRDAGFEELASNLATFHTKLKECSFPDVLIHFQNCVLPAFPNSTFTALRNVNLKLDISERTKIHLFSPQLSGYSVFQNSSFSSVVFDISDSSTLAGWRWEVLKDLEITSRKGFVLNVVRSKLVYLRSDFGKVANGHVTEVVVLKCGLKWLGKNVFAPLVYLRKLELRGNLLENVNRSQLPTMAPDLKILDMGDNRLTSLPDDIFDGLNLQTVLLDGNNLKISDSLAKNILNIKGYLFLTEAIWPCNCKDVLKLKVRFPTDFEDMKCYEDEDSSNTFKYSTKCPMATSKPGNLKYASV